MIDQNSTFGGFLTDVGEAKQANANALGQPWKLTHMLLGDANGTDPVPQPDQTTLINQVYRAAINQLSVDPANPAILIAELVLPPNVGGWWIRELGLEDEDGDFVAVANCPPSYKPLLAQGSGRNQVVRMHLIVSNTANVELKIDPSVVLATRQYADDGDAAVRATTQFATYDPTRIYTTGEVVRGSNGAFYEFYDRDQVGTVQGVDPTNPANRPHIWMEWDGVKPGATIEWRSETLPEGYIENDGSEVSRGDYRRVFSAIGTLYGAGDGNTTFQLPDDRGEFKRGWDHGRGIDSGRQLGSHQLDAFQDHFHYLPTTTGSGGNSIEGDVNAAFYDHEYPSGAIRDPRAGGGGDNNGVAAGVYLRTYYASSIAPSNWKIASETRPRNNAVIYLTKI
ncbi:phage tail protein [Halomonas salifodinae]|uniref:Phage tail protein n=1 Tax=Halomonas salifodinae TaxID=438745 RepID=A0ABW2EW05_9GAMM